MNAAVNYAAFYVVAAYGGKVTVEHAWADEATGNQRIVISYAHPDDLCDLLLNLFGQGACQGLWSEIPAEDVCHA